MAYNFPNASTRSQAILPGILLSCTPNTISRARRFIPSRSLQLRKRRQGTVIRSKSMQPPSYKELVEQKFKARCADYDEKSSYHYKVASELVARASLQPGWNVLDIACGTGLATYLAASAVGQTGSVTGVDLSLGMVEKDVEYATLPSSSFDAALSSSGMPYLDTKIMFKKLHTWLKPGGMLIYNTPECYRKAAEQAPYSPLLTLMDHLLQDSGHSNYTIPFPYMADEVQALQAAGFHDIKVERTSEHLLGEAVPLDVYAQRGWQLVGVGLEPCFPCLLSMSKADLETLKKKFTEEATAIGNSLQNADGLVEDKHDSCKVIAYTHSI